MKRSLTVGVIILLLITLFSTFFFTEKVSGDIDPKEDEFTAQFEEEEEPEIMYYTEDDKELMAKLLYRECRGVLSKTEKACVAWVVLNRVDWNFADGTIRGVITAPGQFASIANTPVIDELYDLSSDVLERWNSEKNGKKDVGRVIPIKYLYFNGDGKHNHFRTKEYTYWDYSLDSPYES